MPHRQTFNRHDTPHLRALKLNELDDRIEAVEVALARRTGSSTVAQAGSVPDPGDLTVYYKNGKA